MVLAVLLITRYGVTVRIPRGIGAVRAAPVRFLVDAVLLFAALWNSRPGGPPPPWYLSCSDKADARLSMVSVLQPQTHVDFVFVCAAEEHMASAAALVHEAERFVQATGPPIRAEDGEFSLLEASSPHPLQDSFHEHAPQADPAPSVPDRNSDSTHVAGLRVRPSAAVRRADRFPVRVGDEQDRPNAVERTGPTPFLLGVRDDGVEQGVDLPAPDEGHVPQEGNRIAKTRRPGP